MNDRYGIHLKHTNMTPKMTGFGHLSVSCSAAPRFVRFLRNEALCFRRSHISLFKDRGETSSEARGIPHCSESVPCGCHKPESFRLLRQSVNFVTVISDGAIIVKLAAVPLKVTLVVPFTSVPRTLTEAPILPAEGVILL